MMLADPQATNPVAVREGFWPFSIMDCFCCFFRRRLTISFFFPMDVLKPRCYLLHVSRKEEEGGRGFWRIEIGGILIAKGGASVENLRAM